MKAEWRALMDLETLEMQHLSLSGKGRFARD